MPTRLHLVLGMPASKATGAERTRIRHTSKPDQKCRLGYRSTTSQSGFSLLDWLIIGFWTCSPHSVSPSLGVSVADASKPQNSPLGDGLDSPRPGFHQTIWTSLGAFLSCGLRLS
ncbi:hypothetical protein ARMSODRAFT_778143 [Armillaria solidipes]|uniref:Uncharacterized protein n=1 Tax=Armillaria solidipes TaxID=1076256 RepID=A0A2H3BZN0_9AGAR|nr:hypothetical protein ARMSODRAFT_778143 [Armillaria solidipes]